MLEGSFLPPNHHTHGFLTQQGQTHQGSHCLVALGLLEPEAFNYQ